MNTDPNIYAKFVWDGSALCIPKMMGVPRDDQLQGTPQERLAELAGRVCYDSLGKGRSSADYHAHIREVGHGSVWEHVNFTVEIPVDDADEIARYALALLNRPGVWARPQRGALRFTVNLRAAVEWEEVAWSQNELACAVRAAANALAPQIAATNPSDEVVAKDMRWRLVPLSELDHPEEKWVSLLLGGSRGMSHEQVRHKWRVAISQRSTRYVDESESPWVEHPLITEFKRAHPSFGGDFSAAAGWDRTPEQEVARAAYRGAVQLLQPWLEGRGVDKHTARKQARGAARGFLGNALHTEMIFSASVAQWRRMLGQRATRHADAEIRALYAPQVLRALKTTCWAADFEDLELVPSPDGIGEVVQYEDPCP